MIPPGTLAAYDEALSFLSSHNEAVRQQISQIDSTSSTSSLPDDVKEELRESLHIASQINDPAILAQYSSQDAASYDASNPTFRHIREKIWRRTGILERIMQRVQLMFVMPDVLPAITPTVDLQVAFGTGTGFTDHESNGGDVLVGCMVDPVHSVEAPIINITSFHLETKKYTLLMVDPDSPSSETLSFKTKVHALKSGIEVSATKLAPVDLHSDMEVYYIPPHPQEGTPYHRYTVIAFEEPEGAAAPAPLTEEQKEDLSVVDFVRERRLVPAGIHFWREEWSKEVAGTVSSIYTDVLRKYLHDFGTRHQHVTDGCLPLNTTETMEPSYKRAPRAERVRKVIGVLSSKWF